MAVPVVVWVKEGKWHASAFGKKLSASSKTALRKEVLKLAHEGRKTDVGNWFDAAAKRVKGKE